GEVFGNEIRIWQIATAREYRTLAPPALWPHIAPDKRLLAAYGPGGLHLWDLATGFWLGRLDCDLVGKSCLFSAQEPMALLAATRSGLQYWPIEPVAEANVVRIGLPKVLSPVVPYTMDWSRDGNVIAAAARKVGSHQPFAGGWILHLGKLDAPIHLDKG